MRVLWPPLKGCMADNYFGQTLHRKMKEGQRAFFAATSLSQFQSASIRIPKCSAWLSCVWNPTGLIPRFKWPLYNSCSTIRKMTRIIYSMHQVLILMVVWQVDDSAHFLGPCHCMASFLEAWRTISGMHRGCAGWVHYLGQMTHCFKNMSQVSKCSQHHTFFLDKWNINTQDPKCLVFFILFFYGAYFWTGMNPIVTYTMNFVCLTVCLTSTFSCYVL